MGFESQLVQLAADVVAPGIQPLRQARLDFPGAVRLEAHLQALPLVQQQFHGLRVQLLALLRQSAAALGMQPCDQGEQQRALGQLGQALVALDRAFEQLGAAFGVILRQAQQLGHVGIPGIHEPLNLAAREGQQPGLGEAVQFPVLLRVGVRAAGDQEAALAESGGEILHCLFHLYAAGHRFGHFVQAVQQDQTAAFQQFLSQVRRVILQSRLLQPARDVRPQRLGVHGRARQRQFAGEVAQDDIHGQQRAMIPALRLRFFVSAVRLWWDGRGECLQVRRFQPEHFAGHAQRDEIDERALAAAGPAQQHQTLLAVEQVDGRQSLRLTVRQRAGAPCTAFRQVLALAALREQCRVDRRQAYLRAGVVAGEERELV